MFHLQAIVFIALFCAVSAAVTVNIYDDDQELTDVHKVGDCDLLQCVKKCLNLGYNSGMCVGGICKCINSISEDVDIDNEVAPVRLPKSFHECNPSACDQLCRRLKFPGGVCVNGRCKCDNFRFFPAVKSTFNEEINDDTNQEVQSCSIGECNIGCKDIGFPGGFCYDGRCECDPRDKEDKTLRSAQTCNSVTCYFTCRRMNYIGGRCQAGGCVCF